VETKQTYINSISALIRKDNTIRYLSNRYSLPQGTYDGTERYADLEPTADSMLIIYDPKTGEEITKHSISYEKGKLIKNNAHRRDMSKKISEYVEHILTLLPQTLQARVFVDKLREFKSRYIRDQLQILEKNIKGVDNSLITKALKYCLKQKLYSAIDFSDTLKYFKELTEVNSKNVTTISFVDIKPIEAKNSELIKTKPEVRDIKIYQNIMMGGKK